MKDILEKIVATKRLEIARASEKVPLEALKERAFLQREKDKRSFAAALRNKAGKGGAVIAEVKKASPSKGLIRPDFNPEEIAKSYEKWGAACLSVLTDEQYFQGSLSYLQRIRKVCSLPLLRKDFIISEYQVYEAAAAGADAILLIAAILTSEELNRLAKLALSLSLDVLVESHNEDDIKKALQTEGVLIGVNNRNLRNFSVDLHTTEELLRHIPSEVQCVTESGIRKPEDVAFMRGLGINSFLVGEAFMREEDPGEGMHRLFFQENER